MNKIKKPILVALTISVLASIIILTITAIKPPTIEEFWVMALVLLLLYVISAALIYIVLILMHGAVKKSALPYALLFGCFPPALLMLVSLRQAGFLDIFIILITVAIIIWYANYKS